MKPHNRQRRTRGRSKAGTATSRRECFARFAMPYLPLQPLQSAEGSDSRRRCPEIWLGSDSPGHRTLFFAWPEKVTLPFL